MKMYLGKLNLAAQMLHPNGGELSGKSPGRFNSGEGATCSH
jgi:hypothetical protein